MTMNRNGIDIRELTGELDCEELDLVSGSGCSGAAAFGTSIGDVAFTLYTAAKTVARVAETVTGHPR